jgi:hypothetical protein
MFILSGISNSRIGYGLYVVRLMTCVGVFVPECLYSIEAY